MTIQNAENNENPARISLAEVSRKAPRILQRGDSLMLDEGAAPTLNDLAGALQFAPGDGRIWLNDDRMVLMQANVLGSLQAQMIRNNGMDRTREMSLRIGWEQGVKLAELVRKRFGQDNLTAALAAGPRLHTIEGFAKVMTKRFEFDSSKQTYLGEFYWIDSVEGTEHFRNFGVCNCPVCWMQVGVPSGYTTTLLGFPVIFREIECVGQGAPRCLVVGKDVSQWEDDVPEMEIFGLPRDTGKKSKPWNPASAITMLDERPKEPEDAIIGSSVALQRAKRLLDKAAPFSEPVILIGEAGTGKEYFARYLHKQGAKPGGPFVAVNCAALRDGPTDQDEMFGADGYLERAKGGTLFLNDFMALSQGMQAKLASVLHETPAAARDFRVVAATGMSPLEAVRSGALRSDLQQFLSILPIEIPSLRERRDDLPALITHFLGVHKKRHAKAIEGLSGAAFDTLLRYDYPGNVRELSNLIERGMIFAEPGSFIEINNIFSTLEQLPEMTRSAKAFIAQAGPMEREPGDSRGTLERLEIELLRATLSETRWNISAAARKLGLTRAKLDYRIKKFGLSEGDP